MNIHPIARVKPITKALWNIYGVPPLAYFEMEQAFQEIRIERLREQYDARKHPGRKSK